MARHSVRSLLGRFTRTVETGFSHNPISKPLQRAEEVDAGLQQIADLEHAIVLAKEQTWTWSGVSPEEIARLLPDVIAQAKAVCDAMRADYALRNGAKS